MSDNQKYYYMRLKDDFFDSEQLKIMESMQDGYLYSNILLKMYLKSLKAGGKLMLNNLIPYNAKMLASVTGHQIGTVERALSIFKELGLIEILDDGAIYIMDIQNYIGKSSTEADRKREYERRILSEKKAKGEISEIFPPEIEIELELEKEIEIEIEESTLSELESNSGRERINYKRIVDSYNSICVSLPKCTKITEARKRLIKCRISDYSESDLTNAFKMAEESDFLSGRNGRWNGANIDWILNPTNIQKIIEGNYKNKNQQSDRGFVDKWRDV